MDTQVLRILNRFITKKITMKGAFSFIWFVDFPTILTYSPRDPMATHRNWAWFHGTYKCLSFRFGDESDNTPTAHHPDRSVSFWIPGAPKISTLRPWSMHPYFQSSGGIPKMMGTDWKGGGSFFGMYIYMLNIWGVSYYFLTWRNDPIWLCIPSLPVWSRNWGSPVFCLRYNYEKKTLPIGSMYGRMVYMYLHLP